jgi:tripartite-type tricarboxylate transporter receptor subunit TctC
LARIVTKELAESFGQQIVVDNRPGAASIIGGEIAARAPADGYTLVQFPTTVTVTVSLYKKLPYDLVRDFTPVTRVASGPSVVVVPASSSLKSIGDLLRLAKDKPGTINSASAGVGTCTFLASELFKKQAGVDLTHVPYRGGGDALTAVLSGEVAVYFAPLAVALPQIQSGKLRALAVTSAKRLPFLPEFPTVAESGVPGFEFSCWYGLLVPAGTPKQTVAKIHSAVISVLEKPDVRKRLNSLGYIPGNDRPEEFAALIKSEIASYREIVRGIPAQ